MTRSGVPAKVAQYEHVDMVAQYEHVDMVALYEHFGMVAQHTLHDTAVTSDKQRTY